MPHSVTDMCLTNYKDKFIFVSGGYNYLETKVVAKYDIENDMWSKAPSIKNSRKLHNSCTIGHNIYIFFGFFKN